jgi:hypothetical protein
MIISLIFFIYPANRLDELRIEAINLMRDQKIQNLKLEMHNANVRKINKKTESFIKTWSDTVSFTTYVNHLKKQIKDPLYREEQEFIHKHMPTLTDFYILDRVSKGEKATNGIDSSSLYQRIKEIEIKSKAEELKVKQEQNSSLLKISFYGTMFGLAIFLIGLYNWYFKVQRPSDIKLKKEAE